MRAASLSLAFRDRKSTRLNSSHDQISYAVFCLKKKKNIANSYKPGIKIDLHFKDLGLIMESAHALGVPVPATATVHELFNALHVKERGGLDHSAVITLLEDLAGVSA